MGNDAQLVLCDDPTLSVVYEVPGSTPRLDPGEVARQVERTTCYICGQEFSVYNPDEEHHIDGRTGPGANAPANRVRICDLCHLGPRSIHSGHLKFYRADDGLLWVERFIDGEWQKQVPYGRLRSGRDLSHTLELSQSFGEWLIRQRQDLANWNDDALKDQYHIADSTAALLFATQCQIVHELATRHSVEAGQTKTGAGLKRTAVFLGVSYQTARLRHAVYQAIFAKVDVGVTWEHLSPEFFYAAYRKKSIMDPIQALNEGENRVLAIRDKDYTAAQFARDIETGFAANPKDGAPVCPYGCANCKKATMDMTCQVWDGNEMVAKGPAEGIWYCEEKGVLASELGPRDACGELTAR